MGEPSSFEDTEEAERESSEGRADRM